MTDAINIFVHNITSRGNAQSLNSAIPGALRYDQRALLVARTEDIVCLHGEDIVFKEANLRGIPVAPGEIMEFTGVPPDVKRLNEAVLRQIGVTGKVIVRGITDFPVPPLIISNTTPDVTGKLQRLVEQQTFHTYLVQAMFNITVSPNVQFTIPPNGGSPSSVSVSDQILDTKLSHKGNISPSLANTMPEMIASARKISDWLQSENYTGVFGIDFVEDSLTEQVAREVHPLTVVL